MKSGIRLFPAVACAAAALLMLKGLALWNEHRTIGTAAVTTSLPEASKSFFAVRGSSSVLNDPESTGSTEPAKKEEKADDKKHDKKAPPPAPVGTPVNLTGPPPLSAAEKALLEKLGERREQLEERQREIETRENLLKAADKKLESRINELKDLETRTGGGASPPGSPPSEAQQAQQQTAALKNLVIMYEAMKPKDAARVFDKLDLTVLVPVVNAMNPKKMSEVLAAMSPDAAGKLTVELATRGLRQTASAGRDGPLPAGELQAIDPRKP